jgi:hypothetical protein
MKHFVECAEPIAPILQIILQQSLDTGDLRKDWRDANISSIFKKGDKHLPENYRPVSLTSAIWYSIWSRSFIRVDLSQ